MKVQCQFGICLALSIVQNMGVLLCWTYLMSSKCFNLDKYGPA